MKYFKHPSMIFQTKEKYFSTFSTTIFFRKYFSSIKKDQEEICVHFINCHIIYVRFVKGHFKIEVRGNKNIFHK
jgi:hypothetical protein